MVCFWGFTLLDFNGLVELDLSRSVLHCRQALSIEKSCINLERVTLGVACDCGFNQNENEYMVDMDIIISIFLRLPRIERLCIVDQTSGNEHEHEHVQCRRLQRILVPASLIAAKALKTLILTMFLQEEVDEFVAQMAQLPFALDVVVRNKKV